MDEHEGGSAAEKLTFLLIGAGIGATLALLFAPKSGRELRDDIADVTRKGVDVAGERVKKASGTASELYETGRTRVGALYETARERAAQSADYVSDAASRQKEQIAAAIEAGKQAYQEEKRRSGSAGATVDGEGA
ncbi:MAG TPA: YtxH domain-containing protein [Blastocatellia bacterium]|nr:YtxH domain-containing protein [Blastocatellia bacterium]